MRGSYHPDRSGKLSRVISPQTQRTERGRRPDGVLLLTTLLILGGVVLRALYFLPDTALWGDEAAVALNLQTRSYRSLISPLALNQHAPYLFLILEKFLYERAGVAEHVLRLPAFVASIAALPLFAWVSIRALTRGAALAAIALFAVSPALIRYGAELKPYGLDVLATLLILAAAIAFERRSNRRWLVLMAIGGAALVWVSYPAVFVLGGVAVTLGIQRIAAHRYAALREILLVALAWFVSFGIVYVLMARHSVSNTDLTTFWDYAFPTLIPHSLWDIRHSVGIVTDVFVDPLQLAGAGMGVILFVLGLRALAVDHRPIAGFCLIPIALTVVASALHVYPFAGRVLLFAAPLLIMPIATGIAAVSRGPAPRWTMAAVAACVLAGPIVGTRDTLATSERSGVRDVLIQLHDRVAPGDAVYVYYKAEPAFALYESRLGRDDVDVVRGRPEIREGDRLPRDLKGLAGHRRVWFLFSEVHTFFVDEQRLVLTAVDRQAHCLAVVKDGPATAYLYQSPAGTWFAD
jgi:hypothetical protein